MGFSEKGLKFQVVKIVACFQSALSLKIFVVMWLVLSCSRYYKDIFVGKCYMLSANCLASEHSGYSISHFPHKSVMFRKLAFH